MRNKTGNMEKTLKRVQGDISGLCKTGKKPTCVAPQNDRFCHPEFISGSLCCKVSEVSKVSKVSEVSEVSEVSKCKNKKERK